MVQACSKAKFGKFQQFWCINTLVVLATTYVDNYPENAKSGMATYRIRGNKLPNLVV